MSKIYGGLDSAGKTYSAIEEAVAGLDPRPSILLDLEYPRAKKTYETHFASKGTLEIKSCKVLYPKSEKGHKRGERNPVASFELFEKELNNLLDNFEKYGYIIIDGISDIRADYSEVWLRDFNIEKKSSRAKIGKDISAWTEINQQIIEQTIAPLQELGSAYATQVIFTAMMAADYKLIKLENNKEDSVKTGKMHIDCHQDIRHKVDTICLLEHEADKYYVSIQKSIRGATERKLMTKPLYEILLEAGI